MTPRPGESPAELAERAVRAEHRPARSWPPVLGGVLMLSSVGVGYGLIADPPASPEWVQFAVFAAWWGGFALACLGALICRGVNRAMSFLAVAGAVTFIGGGMSQWW